MESDFVEAIDNNSNLVGRYNLLCSAKISIPSFVKSNRNQMWLDNTYIHTYIQGVRAALDRVQVGLLNNAIHFRLVFLLDYPLL